ncbi:unnamed protein product [Prorocentrum cordatum]|uniref:RING-CH-type domain-containing protein n=1 Tax=Prorocentrum cordatum TaxID=2364126 RepID=A0ABN9QMR5_9DINO|nr:unnamed protein product [Polarella glacialis]
MPTGPDASAEPIIQPCACRGSMSGVHTSCVETWIAHHRANAINDEVPKCTVCNQPYSGTERRPGALLYARHICRGVARSLSRSVLLVLYLIGYWAAAQEGRPPAPLGPCGGPRRGVAGVTAQVAGSHRLTPARPPRAGRLLARPVHGRPAADRHPRDGAVGDRGDLLHVVRLWATGLADFLPLPILVIMPMGSAMLRSGLPRTSRAVAMAVAVISSPVVLLVHMGRLLIENPRGAGMPGRAAPLLRRKAVPAARPASPETEASRGHLFEHFCREQLRGHGPLREGGAQELQLGFEVDFALRLLAEARVGVQQRLASMGVQVPLLAASTSFNESAWAERVVARLEGGGDAVPLGTGARRASASLQRGGRAPAHAAPPAPHELAGREAPAGPELPQQPAGPEALARMPLGEPAAPPQARGRPSQPSRQGSRRRPRERRGQRGSGAAGDARPTSEPPVVATGSGAALEAEGPAVVGAGPAARWGAPPRWLPCGRPCCTHFHWPDLASGAARGECPRLAAGAACGGCHCGRHLWPLGDATRGAAAAASASLLVWLLGPVAEPAVGAAACEGVAVVASSAHGAVAAVAANWRVPLGAAEVLLPQPRLRSAGLLCDLVAKPTESSFYLCHKKDRTACLKGGGCRRPPSSPSLPSEAVAGLRE